jgi:hypothetical protein
MREILWQEDHPVEAEEEDRADEIDYKVDMTLYLKWMGQ